MAKNPTSNRHSDYNSNSEGQNREVRQNARHAPVERCQPEFETDRIGLGEELGRHRDSSGIKDKRSGLKYSNINMKMKSSRR